MFRIYTYGFVNRNFIRGAVQICRRQTGANTQNRIRVAQTAWHSTKVIDKLYPKHDDFSERHIGPGNAEKAEMLEYLGLKVCS